MDSLCLQLTQVLRSPDLAIFVSMTTIMMTEPVTLPLAHVRGVIKFAHARSYYFGGVAFIQTNRYSWKYNSTMELPPMHS